MDTVRTEDAAPYNARTSASAAALAADDQIITQALQVLQNRLTKPGEALTSPQSTVNYLRLRLAEREHEVFACLFLDNRHRLIAYEELFRGTIDAAAVYPREIVKEALKHNAAALILAHNHPSGVTDQSRADERMTSRIKEACQLFDIRVLDHVIVGGDGYTSFAEKGFI